ncbi:hypothetical protein L6452_43602 [Arctium lappa]|uniref:Uncharacterized protein n=1 Tax=Arctium lappa TaxID=4217 RepID=A0ACB8XCY6_ARCLA|nr:hypothetical protein L6452_43602 [Arctium lappa]
MIPSQRSSTLTITELDSDSEDPLDTDLSEFDELLTLLTNCFRRFSRKSNFRRKKPLTISDKPKSTLCRSKKAFKPFSSRKSSDDKSLKLKEKYQKLKGFKRKGKGLIVEEHDWAESKESSSDEQDAANLCLIDEIKEEVEEPTGTSTSTTTSLVSISSDPTLTEAERHRIIDVLMIDLYNALNGKKLKLNIKILI